MNTPKIFLVLPISEKMNIDKFCSDTIVPSWRHCIRSIDVSSPGKTVDAYWTDEAERVAGFFESCEPDASSVLLVHKETTFSHDTLRALWEEHGYTPSNFYVSGTKAIREKIRKLSIAANAFWKTYAENQLHEYEGRKTDPTVWMEQFNQLGIGYIGKRILMQIRAIRFDNDKRPFGARKHEAIGQKVCYCFISDEDPGGSWVTIKDLLAHEHRPEDVSFVSWNSESGDIALPSCAADELIVCEDGLWSGSETKKRLNALSGKPQGQKMRLKFAVVSDFGLRIVRHSIRYLKIRNTVQVDAHDAELFTFLRSDLPENLSFGAELDPQDYFKELHNYVEPAVFRDPGDWPEGREQAIEICKSIGEQLVRQWYQDKRPDEDANAAAAKFCLGGGGFASTVFFKRSVPKVCLPLLWLDGEVIFDSKKVRWRPLLVDSRRIRDDSLLFE